MSDERRITTANAACRAFRAIRDEEDALAMSVYDAAHEAHVVLYPRVPGARRGLFSSPWRRRKLSKAEKALEKAGRLAWHEVWYLPIAAVIDEDEERGDGYE